MDKDKLIKYLERRVHQSEDLKCNPEVHNADKLFFSGHGKAFQEIIDYLNGKSFINEKGELEYFKEEFAI